VPSKHPFFDISRLRLASVQGRTSRVAVTDLAVPRLGNPSFDGYEIQSLAAHIVAARAMFQPVIFFIGAHVLKCGLGLYLRQLAAEKYVTLIASNGAATIHDFELAMFGATSEHVGASITDGTFGLWKENEQINKIAKEAASVKRGFGEHLGFWLSRWAANPGVSVFAGAYENKVPFTVHSLIGGDITHMHAGRGDGIGQASYNDFLIFAEHLKKMQEQGGVFVNIGSAVHGPEIYLKSLSMARNVLRQDGTKPAKFTTGVLDMYPLPTNWRDGEAGENEPGYYFRPWKTILLRSLNDGCASYYVRGNHMVTLPALYQWIHKLERENKESA